MLLAMTTTRSAVSRSPVSHPSGRLPPTRSFTVELVHPDGEGFSPGHEYVRRFWAAVVGNGAIRDLLDIFLAGLRRRAVPEPFYLSVLLAAGLAEVNGEHIRMPVRVPLLHSSLVARLNPGLRFDHRRFEPGTRSCRTTHRSAPANPPPSAP